MDYATTMDPFAMVDATSAPMPPTAAPSSGVPITTIVIHKVTDDSPLGMTVVGGQGGAPVITKIDPNGLAAHYSDLQPGLRILTVNGAACQSRDEFVALTRSCPAGAITLQLGPATLVAATVTKAVSDQPVGISMAPEKRDDGTKTGALVVTKVDPHGLFAETDLRVGMQLVRVNDQEIVPHQTDVKDVVAMLRSVDSGTITVIVNNLKKAPPPKPRPASERRWSYSKHTESEESGRIIENPNPPEAAGPKKKRFSFRSMAMNNRRTSLV